MKSAMKDIDTSLFYWGVPKRYQLGFAVRAVEWQAVDEKIKNQVDKKTSHLAQKIRDAHGKSKPDIKTRGLFALTRQMQKQGFNEADRVYWEKKGWIGDRRPWK